MLAAKVGIKYCRGARECVSFVYVLYVRSYPTAIVYLCGVQCWVVSDSLFANYLFPSFYCDLFKFNYLVCLLFIAYCNSVFSAS